MSLSGNSTLGTLGSNRSSCGKVIQGRTVIIKICVIKLHPSYKPMWYVRRSEMKCLEQEQGTGPTGIYDHS